MHRRTWKVLGTITAGLVAMGQNCLRLNCTILGPLPTDIIVVELGTTLDSNDSNLLVGTEIPISSITGSKFAGPEDGCPDEHLHAADPSKGIMIDGKGPFFDPAPSGCGYGLTYTIRAR